ncbi:MAG: membrane protein insertase YidC [Deltaproteobacteria bacterium]|nr:membrane protein insertase YidC [Deltaproteobacteria bacterium]
MEHRLLITIVFCLAVFLGWWLLFPQPQHPQVQQSGQPAAPAAAPVTVAAPAPATAPATGAAVVPPTREPPAAAAAPPDQRGKEQVVVVEQPGLFRAELSSWGGRIRSYRLLDPQYLIGGEKRSLLDTVKGWFGDEPRRPEQQSTHPLDLVSVAEETFWPLGLTLPRSGLTLSGREQYEVVEQSAERVVFRYRDPAGRATIEKDYRFRPGSHLFELQVRVTNHGLAPMTRILTLNTNGWQDPEHEQGSIFVPAINLRSAVCYVREEVIRKPSTELKQVRSWATESGEVLWSGTEDQYFLQAVLPGKTEQAEAGQLPRPASCSFLITEDNVVLSVYGSPAMEVAPGQTSTQSFGVYFGPKQFYTLREVGQKLQLAVDFRWDWLRIICEPMLWLMRLFHGWTGNWGVAIIFLTLFVKLALFPFSYKSFKSMAAQQKLMPEMKAIQEKFKNDAQRRNEEILKLYNRHKISPFAFAGGCLPMLMQMPIYFALYQTIFSSAELYKAGFFFYLDDLSAPDPYFVTPLLLGAIMWVQQKITPTPAMDSAQVRMMQWMMPIMFTAFMLFLPSGLVLYILANSVFTIAQQMLIQRRRLAKA